MPNKKAILKAILSGGLAVGEVMIPGLGIAKQGIDAILEAKADTDNEDDADEIAAGLSKVIIGTFAAAEGVTEKDLVNDPVLVALMAKIRQDIVGYEALVKAVAVKRPPVPA